jgi:hypothetical protein
MSCTEECILNLYSMLSYFNGFDEFLLDAVCWSCSGFVFREHIGQLIYGSANYVVIEGGLDAG